MIRKKRCIDLLPSAQPHSTSLRRLARLWLAETRTMEKCRTRARKFLLALVLCTHVMLRAVELLCCLVQAGSRGNWERDSERGTWQVQEGEQSGGGSLPAGGFQPWFRIPTQPLRARAEALSLPGFEEIPCIHLITPPPCLRQFELFPVRTTRALTKTNHSPKMGIGK